MWDLAQQKKRAESISVDCIEAGAEDILLKADCADTVVMDYTLCTLPELSAALAEMRRVLKPGGELIFCEHGAVPDADVRKRQDRMNTIWKPLAGGCNLNRDIPSLLTGGGFDIREMDTMYLPAWRPGTFNFWGTAV